MRDDIVMGKQRLGAVGFFLLCGLTLGALVVHGYHPYVEDAEIYLPGVLKQLHPALFPHDSAFFLSHAHMTLFPKIVATSFRVLHFPLGAGLLCWQVATIFLLLYACWRVAQICFGDTCAVWGGVSLVAALLTIPVAGTALYIMDQYLTARSISTPAAVLAVASALEGAYVTTALWVLLAAFVHPQMAVFAAALIILIAVLRRPRSGRGLAAMVFARDLFPPVTAAYRRVLETRPYFFLSRWAWFEWLGIFAPAVLLAWFRQIAVSRKMVTLELACTALLLYQCMFFGSGLVISMPGRFENLAEIQPLRSLHLLYILLFVFMGGLLGKFVLRRRPLRWVMLFAPLCFGMWFAQRRLFPATPHLEWPWLATPNPWVQAFEWIQENTPENAYFALDPQHMELPGEDEHGFRAIAQRSMLADAIKDSGAATVFPNLAPQWEEQVDAQQGWGHFRTADLLRLKKRYGVNWVIQKSAIAGLVCPYRNSSLAVCRLD